MTFHRKVIAYCSHDKLPVHLLLYLFSLSLPSISLLNQSIAVFSIHSNVKKCGLIKISNFFAIIKILSDANPRKFKDTLREKIEFFSQNEQYTFPKIAVSFFSPFFFSILLMCFLLFSKFVVFSSFFVFHFRCCFSSISLLLNFSSFISRLFDRPVPYLQVPNDSLSFFLKKNTAGNSKPIHYICCIA